VSEKVGHDSVIGTIHSVNLNGPCLATGQPAAAAVPPALGPLHVQRGALRRHHHPRRHNKDCDPLQLQVCGTCWRLHVRSCCRNVLTNVQVHAVSFVDGLCMIFCVLILSCSKLFGIHSLIRGNGCASPIAVIGKSQDQFSHWRIIAMQAHVLDNEAAAGPPHRLWLQHAPR
jgi:hypothetical protein